MKKLFVFILLALSLTAFAQQKKVAVYVTGQETGINKVLGDQLVAAFAKSGKYTAIERTASFLAEINKEQNYQRTGAVDDNEISRLGKQFGVNYVCVADVSSVFGEKYVSARLIDVESAEVINASNATSSLSNMAEVLKVSEQIANQLAGKTSKEKGHEEQALKEAQYAQKQFEQNEKEKEYLRIKNSMEAGYIKMDNLLVVIPDFSRKTYKAALQTAKDCTLAGYSDWRLPTQSEISQIMRISEQYNKICPDFPNFRDGEHGWRTQDGYYYTAVIYWCKDKYYYELMCDYSYQNGREEYYVKKIRVERGTLDGTIARQHFVVLVR